MKLSAALERDRDLYSGDKDERPFKYAVESFIEVIGDKDVTAIILHPPVVALAAKTPSRCGHSPRQKAHQCTTVVLEHFR